MKKLFFVHLPDNRLEQLVLGDFFKSHATKKTVVLHPSYEVINRFRSDEGTICRNFAQYLAKVMEVCCLSLGETISVDSINGVSSRNLWRFLGESSDYYTDNIIIVLPYFIFTSLDSGIYSFRREIKDVENLYLKTPGSVAVVDFTEWEKTSFPVERYIDNRFKYIPDLPWQLTPSGYSSPTKNGEDTRSLLDGLILSWLGVAGTQNSWARNVRRRVLKKVNNLMPYLTYPVAANKKVA